MQNSLLTIKIPKNRKVMMKKNTLNVLILNYPQEMIMHKKRKKIKSEDFVIPHLNEYDKILMINYNCKQLKKICEYFHIPKTGNKNILTRRIYTTLKLSKYIISIQKIFRGYLIRNFIKLSGPALFNRSLCVNKTDFLSLENIDSIGVDNFISFKDNDGFIYGFELGSIYNLILSCRKKKKKNLVLKNPYNRKVLSLQNIQNIRKKIKLAKILRYSKIDDMCNLQKKVETKRQLKFKVIDVFHKFDMFGHTTNIDWFLSLTKFQLLRYVRELKDMWFHRLDLTNDTRKRIFPPQGNPFTNWHRSFIIQKNILYIQKNVIYLIDNMISKGITNEFRTLGVYYVLTALTQVSPSAALALPWLYDSAHIGAQNIPMPN